MNWRRLCIVLAALVALLGKPADTISRAEQLGLGDVTPGDVQRARGGKW